MPFAFRFRSGLILFNFRDLLLLGDGRRVVVVPEDFIA